VTQHQTYVKKCEHCGKMCFTARKLAKKYVSDFFPGQGLTVYRCEGNPDYFHFGHTPWKVARGVQERGYATAKRREDAELAVPLQDG
jgi:hypothetical protein